MAFPYYQPYPYYPQPVPDQLAQLRQNQFQQPRQEAPSIVWVQSEQEALNYLVAPNSAVTLWDSNSPVVYLKQADASGKPSLKVYDLVERTGRPVSAPAVEYAPLARLEALEARLDALAAKERPSAKKAGAKEDGE